MDFLDREYEYMELEQSGDYEAAEALRSIDAMLENIQEDDGKDRLYAINQSAVDIVDKVYQALRVLIKGTGVKITKVMGEPTPTSAHILVRGRNIKCDNMPWFIKLCRLATVVDSSATTDGNVELYFTFHGLAKEIEL